MKETVVSPSLAVDVPMRMPQMIVRRGKPRNVIAGVKCSFVLHSLIHTFVRCSCWTCSACVLAGGIGLVRNVSSALWL